MMVDDEWVERRGIDSEKVRQAFRPRITADDADAQDEKPEWLSNVQRVTLRPGDQLVVRYPGTLSQASIARLSEAFEKSFPGRKVLVLEEGLELQVVGPPDDSELREVLGQAWAMLEQGSNRKQVIEMIAHALGMNEPPEIEE